MRPHGAGTAKRATATAAQRRAEIPLSAITPLSRLGYLPAGHFRSHYGSEFHTKRAMRALLHTAFAALHARAGVSQATFGRIRRHASPGQQLMPRTRRSAALGDRACRGPARHLPEAIRILLEETAFAWHETLGVPSNADTAALRLAMARLELISIRRSSHWPMRQVAKVFRPGWDPDASASLSRRGHRRQRPSPPPWRGRRRHRGCRMCCG